MKIIQTVKNHKLAFGGGAVAVIGLLSWVAFGFFGIHTAFIDDVVDEDGPVFTVTPEGDGETAAPAAETDDAVEAETDEAETDDAGTDDPAADDPAAADPAADDPAADENEAAAGEIVTLFEGSFSGLSRYDVSGDALVLNNGTEQRFLRFENFESNNGPDLKVYLRADNGDFVNLGDLSGNIGNQNYEIPADVDLEVFNTVDIWCERFSVGFGVAELTPTA